MVERFDGHIEGALQSQHFRSGEDLGTTLHRMYGFTITRLHNPPEAKKTPLQAMKQWHKRKPELLNKQPYYRTGSDN